MKYNFFKERPLSLAFKLAIQAVDLKLYRLVNRGWPQEAHKS